MGKGFSERPLGQDSALFINATIFSFLKVILNIAAFNVSKDQDALDWAKIALQGNPKFQRMQEIVSTATLNLGKLSEIEQ